MSAILTAVLGVAFKEFFSRLLATLFGFVDRQIEDERLQELGRVKAESEINRKTAEKLDEMSRVPVTDPKTALENGTF